MALMIPQDCTACDACKPACPNEAIAEGSPMYVIDALRCTECVGAEDEPQCSLMCPADCIVPNPDFVESREELQATFKSALQAGLAKLDLVTREEFEVQRAVLLRTREKLEALEQAVAALEKRPAGDA